MEERMEKCYTPKDLSEKFNVSEATIRRLLDSDQMEGNKIGGQWRVTQDQLDRYLEKTKNGKNSA
jgi:excisionase family DNA binding protein